ncbi:MAG: hypothetical protein LBH64_03025 [Coriobacteriales bacterium]|jgi:hypothetical protein|nr:hypothetical protein [Coriobacteriales bacterium]
MPALLTHNYFGEDVLRCLGNAVPVAEARRVFLLGNQGPDPFFYALRTPRLVQLKEFGSLMHAEKAAETLEAFRRYAFAAPEPRRSLLTAYLLGFVCHFTLDSVMHPFVYAQQHAVCDAGIEGLDRRDGSIVHGQIEADLDMMMLCRRRGEGIRAHDYTGEVLRAGSGALKLLDATYETLAREVYTIDLPPTAFSRGVRDMRLTIALLYSRRGIKRRVVGAIERLFRRHSLVQAMSPCVDIGVTCDFDNRERAEWKHPFADESSCADFDELYTRALGRALDNIAALLEGSPAAVVTGGLDFEGAVAAS